MTILAHPGCAERPDDGGLAAGIPDDVHGSTRDLLASVQQWLADERTHERTLVVLTHGAVATEAGEDVPGLAQSPAWGLLRTTQTEHPGRFVLLDVDGHDESWRSVPAAVATALADGEPQLALRRGGLKMPRLAKTDLAATLAPPPGSGPGTSPSAKAPRAASTTSCSHPAPSPRRPSPPDRSGSPFGRPGSASATSSSRWACIPDPGGSAPRSRVWSSSPDRAWTTSVPVTG